MNKLTIYCRLLAGLCIIFSGCGETKRIFKGNYAFKYVDNQDNRGKHLPLEDRFYVYEIREPLTSKITDKTDYLVIKPDPGIKPGVLIDSILVKPKPEKIQMNGVIYSTETGVKEFDKYQRSFTYSDWKFALQTLAIPLKFRKALDDGTKFPNQVESGINIGFAPVIKYNINVYDPGKKTMGKSTNQYSINTGLIFNLGTADLKTASNAPGLKSDRKSPMFSFGTFLMFGINNINFGYAIGLDKIIGEGHSYWVYQNKMWHGVIIALDIIKP
jgi:hypothetical protein